jgi:hypothetical protein
METETIGYRSTETRHGGTVGWFVDHLSGAGRNKSATRKRQAEAGFQQAELWPAHGAAVAVEAPPLEEHLMAQLEGHLHEPATFSESVSDVQPVMARVRSLSRRIVVAAKAERPVEHKPGRTIARYMNFTGAIEGLRGDVGVRFDLPARSLSSMLRLWRGSNVSSDYTPVYF